MRKLMLAMAATALLSAASFIPNSAEAMTLPAPAGLQTALADSSMVQEAAYVCRRRCGPRGCFRRCWWTDPRPGVYFYGPGYPGYYGSPYYGRHWHRRHWW